MKCALCSATTDLTRLNGNVHVCPRHRRTAGIPHQVEGWKRRSAAFAQYVYFVQSVYGGPIKIGSSITTLARLEALQTGCPVPLRLLAETRRWTEAACHQRFRAHRLHGEWFGAAACVLQAVGAARADGPLPECDCQEREEAFAERWIRGPALLAGAGI